MVGRRAVFLLFLCIVAEILAVEYDDDDWYGDDGRVTPDAIMELSNDQDIDSLHWLLSDAFRRSERSPISVGNRILSHDEVQEATTQHKLQHDLEQAEYLAENLENKAMARFFGDIVAPIYRNVTVTSLDELGMYEFTQQDKDNDIHHIYNKALYVTDFDELLDENGETIPLLSDSFYEQQDDIQDEFWNGPKVVVIDDLLTPRALTRIRQVLLESTVWYEAKSPVDTGNYVGAYLNDGLHDRILLALAFELHEALPRIMTGHPLAFLWAYKYESQNQGIKTHTDFAAININLWITPNDANLNQHVVD